MEHLANIRQRYDKEADRWRKIWDASGVRVITLYGQPALIMPYFKMCKGDASVQDEDVKKAAGDAIEQMLRDATYTMSVDGNMSDFIGAIARSVLSWLIWKTSLKRTTPMRPLPQ